MIVFKHVMELYELLRDANMPSFGQPAARGAASRDPVTSTTPMSHFAVIGRR